MAVRWGPGTGTVPALAGETPALHGWRCIGCVSFRKMCYFGGFSGFSGASGVRWVQGWPCVGNLAPGRCQHSQARRLRYGMRGSPPAEGSRPTGSHQPLNIVTFHHLTRRIAGSGKTGLLAANAFIATSWGARKYFWRNFRAGGKRVHFAHNAGTLPTAGPNEIRQDAGSTQAATPNSEVRTGNSRKVLIDSGSGRRREGNFAPAGCRRGAHGVTRPTALGARRVFSISLPTSEFGVRASPDLS